MSERASGRRESDEIGESESGGRGRSRGGHGRREDKRRIGEMNGAIEEMAEVEKWDVDGWRWGWKSGDGRWWWTMMKDVWKGLTVKKL